MKGDRTSRKDEGRKKIITDQRVRLYGKTSERHRETERSIQQGQSLRFSREGRIFEGKNLFILWLFASVLQGRNQPWVLQENNTQE